MAEALGVFGFAIPAQERIPIRVFRQPVQRYKTWLLKIVLLAMAEGPERPLKDAQVLPASFRVQPCGTPTSCDRTMYQTRHTLSKELSEHGICHNEGFRVTLVVSAPIQVFVRGLLGSRRGLRS